VSYQQLQSVKSALAQEQKVAADQAKQYQEAVSKANSDLTAAQNTLTNDESNLTGAEDQLSSDEQKLATDEAAEAAACGGSSPGGSGGSGSACSSAQSAVQADQSAVSADNNAIKSDQTAVTNQQQVVTDDQYNVTSAQQAQRTGDDQLNAQIAADQHSVSNAQASYNQVLASNLSSGTPSQSTIAQESAAVTSDQIIVQQDQAALAGTTLTAPFTGTVVSIGSDLGMYVSGSGSSGSGSSSSSGSAGTGSSGTSGTSGSSGSAGLAATSPNGAGTGAGGAGSSLPASGFMVLTDLSGMLVHATFDETDAATIKVGATATVAVNALPNQAIAATVAQIDPTSTTSSSVVEYGVTLSLSQEVSGMKPGQSASVTVITGEVANALYVPSTAVTTAGAVSTVTVVSADGSQHTVVVTLGLKGTTDDQILSGLTVGERVVTSPATTGGGSGFPGGGFPGLGNGGGLGRRLGG
jgi:multidrug efflux pump subunit AcrA (membrane-fusion protein)